MKLIYLIPGWREIKSARCLNGPPDLLRVSGENVSSAIFSTFHIFLISQIVDNLYAWGVSGPTTVSNYKKQKLVIF